MAQTFGELINKAGAGKPVSASTVPGSSNQGTRTKKQKTLSELIAEQAAGSGGRGPSGTPVSGTPRAASPTYENPAEAYLRAAGAAGGASPSPTYTPDAYSQPEEEDPMVAALRRQQEIAEQYARAEREYKQARAEMQMMAMSGGMVSADAAAREQSAREAYLRAKEENDRALRDTDEGRAVQDYRQAMAELQMAAQSGGLVSVGQAEKERESEAALREMGIATDQRAANVVKGAAKRIGAGYSNALATGIDATALVEGTRTAYEPLYSPLTGGDREKYRREFREETHETVKPVYEAADRWSEGAAADLEKAKLGLGNLGQAGVDIAENMLEMGFDAVVGSVAGAAGLPGGSLGSMFIRVLGNAEQEARQSGATLEQQLAYGLSSAGIEFLTEKISGVATGIFYGKGAADDFTEMLIGKLAQTDTGRSALRLLMGAVSEGGEEVLSDLLSPLAEAMYKTDEQGNRLSVGQLYGQRFSADGLAEMAYDFLIGAAVGALSGGGSILTGADARANQELREQQNNEPGKRNAQPEGRASLQTEGGDDIINGTLRRAAEMQREGRSPSEIYNETGLFTLNNGRFRDSRTGEIYDAGAVLNDQGGNAANNPGGLQREQRAGGEIGGSGENNQRQLRPARGWSELNEQERATAREAINKYADNSPGGEMSALMAAFTESGLDGQEEIAKRIYEDLRVSPVIAENRWGNFFSDINGLLEEMSKGGKTNAEQAGEQSIDAASENGNDGVRAVGEGGQPGQVEGAQPGGQGKVREGVQEGTGENLRSVTLRELGVTNAAEGATITVQDENSLTGDAQKAAQQVRQLGMEPVAYQGDMIVNGQSVNGYIENGKVFFRTDAKYRDGTPISPEAIVRHEAVHEAKTRDPKIIDIGMEIVRQSRTEAQVLAMMDAYRETYQDLYDFENMSEEEITQRLVEEIVADAYAGMNYFRAGGETVEKIRNAIGGQVESQTAETSRESTGPPEELTYRGLTNKKPMRITILSRGESDLQGLSMKDIVDAGIENVRALQNPRNSEGKQFVRVNDTGYDLLVSRESLRHGLVKLKKGRGLSTAALECKIGEILQNAIKVNELKPRSSDGSYTKGKDVLLGYAEDADNAYVLRATVDLNEGLNDLGEIDIFPLLRSAKAKKTGSTPVHASHSQDDQVQYQDATHSITIQQLLDLVKDQYPDILPDEVLNSIGSSRKEALALDGSIKEQMKYSTEVAAEDSETKGYTVREGVGKLFADQMDRLTEMADRQGTYYDGVQEMLTDALVNAESEEDLDRRLAGMDSARFAYSPELTEKLWELRELIQVDGEKGQWAPSASPQNDRGTKGETVQQEFDRLMKELQEEGHDAEYYQSRGRRCNELMQLGAQMPGSEQGTGEKEHKAHETEQKAEKEDESRGPIGEDGVRTVKAEDAAAELMDMGQARVKNDAGTFLLTVRRKGDGNFLARVDHNGKLAASKRFETAEEAAAYAQSWVEGRTQGQEDAELDLEKSEYKEPQGLTEQLFDREAYQKEIDRQKKNKAAEAATQTLRERIRRANEELKALRRLEKATGLTEEQKKHKADVQETLDIMNDELTSRKGKRQAKKEKAKATGNKPTRSAAEAKNALIDLFHTAAGERADTGRAVEAKLSEIFETGKLTEQGRQELFDMLMEKGETVKRAESIYEEIRNSLKGTRIYVSEADRKGYGDNWDSLRRRAWAAGIYLTNDVNDKGADVHNQELSEIYGERAFPTDIAAQDMLENMIDLAEKGRPTKQSLREALEEEAEQERVDPAEIFSDMWNRMEETLRTYTEKAGLEVDLKNRNASQIADERQRWQERMDRRAQARRESEIRGKLLNGLKRLERVRNKTAPEIKSAIEEILKDIDTQARQITPSGLEDLQALQRAYEDARKAAGYENDENMGNWIPNPYVEKRLAALTKKHVNDMDLQEVIELGRTVAGLEHAIATQNKMIGDEWDSTIESEANGVRDDVEAAKGAKPGFFQKWFMEEHLSPRRFLEMLGGWKDGSMKKLSRSLEDGQTRMLDFQRRATQSFDTFLSKKENRKWLKTASGKNAAWQKYTVVDGVNEDGASYSEIELTPMMKISLYLHSRNMDNLRHIQTGGIVIPNKELYQKGKIAEAYAQGQRVKMNPESVRKIAGELSDVEKTFANHMIRVFDTISKDAINEVSMQLDGFERAGVENYMPIETDRNFIKSDVAGEARAQTVEGIGSIANERIHASNPVMLIDASDVLARQIDKVGRYYGYAIPIRNFQAVNNYVFHEEGAPFSTSVKELMGKKWGSGAEQYITKMLQDLQSSGRSSDMTSRALSALRGHLAGATLAFNPAVAVSQTASYPGAAQAVGWDGLAAGLVAGKVDTKLIEKYTPLYWYRNQGNSTQELGDYMKDKSMEQKLPWVFNWIQKMDSATVRRLWAAAEYRVAKDNPNLKPGSQADIDAGRDAYYKKVAEVFNRAVYDTQPNYTNMERAQILRSDSDVTRFLTMYKTVPLQYYGMMVEATGRLRAAVQSGDKAQIGQAQKYALDTFGGLLAANTVYVAMKALFKTYRKKDKDYRDEDGNITAESYAKQLGKDLLETYAGTVIGGAEALSVIQSLASGKKWTGPEMSSLSYVEEMVNAVGDITDALGEEDPRKAAKAIKNSAETLAMGFGIPAKNMETYIMATVRRIWPQVGMEFDNLFGGIQKSDLKNMDGDAVSMATGLILSNRTGENLGKAVNDELARLYSAGYTEAVPTSMPDSFTYNGNTVTIKDRTKYGDTWGAVVGDNLEELMASDHYQASSDKEQAKMVNRLYEYATVQARKGADPAYSAEGNSTYGWTVKADEAVAAGISLPDTICALNAFAGMTADKDEDGNSISGSKKAKVCNYIDEMDLTVEQKDLLYLLSGYKENSLPYTPWHGWTEDEAGSGGKSTGGKKRSGGRKSSGGKKSSGGRSGKRSSGSGTGSTVKLPDGTFSTSTGAYAGFDAAKLFGGSGKSSSKTDAIGDIVKIVDKHYNGNVLEAMLDGWQKAKVRTTVDFKL